MHARNACRGRPVAFVRLQGRRRWFRRDTTQCRFSAAGAVRDGDYCLRGRGCRCYCHPPRSCRESHLRDAVCCAVHRIEARAAAGAIASGTGWRLRFRARSCPAIRHAVFCAVRFRATHPRCADRRYCRGMHRGSAGARGCHVAHSNWVSAAGIAQPRTAAPLPLARRVACDPVARRFPGTSCAARLD
jgi:hypothetical protein